MYHWSDIPKGCCLLISSTEKDHRIMNPFLARSCKKFYQSLMHENPQSLAIKLADRGNSRGWARQIGTVPLGGSDSFTLHTTWHTTWMTLLLDHGPNQCRSRVLQNECWTIFIFPGDELGRLYVKKEQKHGLRVKLFVKATKRFKETYSFGDGISPQILLCCIKSMCFLDVSTDILSPLWRADIWQFK